MWQWQLPFKDHSHWCGSTTQWSEVRSKKQRSRRVFFASTRKTAAAVSKYITNILTRSSAESVQVIPQHETTFSARQKPKTTRKAGKCWSAPSGSLGKMSGMHGHDPFAIRLDFVNALRKLNASQSSINKLLSLAIRNAPASADDIWSCVMQECQKVISRCCRCSAVRGRLTRSLSITTGFPQRPRQHLLLPRRPLHRRVLQQSPG